jgi:hypothetical protein
VRSSAAYRATWMRLTTAHKICANVAISLTTSRSGLACGVPSGAIWSPIVAESSPIHMEECPISNDLTTLDYPEPSPPFGGVFRGSLIGRESRI